MKKSSNVVYAVATIVLVVTFAAFPSLSSALTRNVVGGILTGASDVDVGGILYDVKFKSGSCIEVFGGCDKLSDFTFTDFFAARAAARALLDVVLLDVPEGNFDSQPDLVNGLELGSIGGLIAGKILTPYDFPASFTGYVATESVANYDITQETRDDLVNLFVPKNWIYGATASGPCDDCNGVWAVWTPVPEPATVMLLAGGLFGLGALRRKFKK